MQTGDLRFHWAYKIKYINKLTHSFEMENDIENNSLRLTIFF